MNGSSITLTRTTIPPDVQDFAAAKDVARYLDAMIELVQNAFPLSAMCASLGSDAEDETHQYIALDIDANNRTAEELLAGQRVWSAGVVRVCPSRDAVYFVLGWR